jgi:RimJ/RimL family protein N-acetyltransferase
MELEQVTLNSQELVLSVFENAPSYFLRVEGCRPSLATVTEAILGEPLNKCAQYGKEFLLIRKDGRPIATAELHLHHPDSGICYLGLLLVREDLWGQGMGRECYFAVEHYLRHRHQCHSIRLGVSDENDVSGFWSKLGFRSNGRNYCYEGHRKANNVVEYEKTFYHRRMFHESQGPAC